jgi:hypothetical protein
MSDMQESNVKLSSLLGTLDFVVKELDNMIRSETKNTTLYKTICDAKLSAMLSLNDISEAINRQHRDRSSERAATPNLSTDVGA